MALLPKCAKCVVLRQSQSGVTGDGDVEAVFGQPFCGPYVSLAPGEAESFISWRSGETAILHLICRTHEFVLCADRGSQSISLVRIPQAK
jgi:hypothetical protein